MKNYYRSCGHIKFKLSEKKSVIDKTKISDNMKDVYDQYQYLFDPSLSPYDRLAKYITDNEKDIFVTGEQIKNIVNGDI